MGGRRYRLCYYERGVSHLLKKRGRTVQDEEVNGGEERAYEILSAWALSWSSFVPGRTSMSTILFSANLTIMENVRAC